MADRRETGKEGMEDTSLNRMILIGFILNALLVSQALAIGYPLVVIVFSRYGNTPIQGATVTLYSESTGQQVSMGETNNLGRVDFDNIAPGQYTIDVQAVGYESRQALVQIVDKWERVDIGLEPITNSSSQSKSLFNLPDLSILSPSPETKTFIRNNILYLIAGLILIISLITLAVSPRKRRRW